MTLWSFLHYVNYDNSTNTNYDESNEDTTRTLSEWENERFSLYELTHWNESNVCCFFLFTIANASPLLLLCCINGFKCLLVVCCCIYCLFSQRKPDPHTKWILMICNRLQMFTKFWKQISIVCDCVFPNVSLMISIKYEKYALKSIWPHEIQTIGQMQAPLFRSTKDIVHAVFIFCLEKEERKKNVQHRMLWDWFEPFVLYINIK